MMRLHLLAHAPTAAQRRQRFPADEGIEPVASDLGDRLAARLGALNAIWRGPERRAAETATALGLTATSCGDLRAWSAGAWSGRTISSVVADDPAGFRAWCTDPDAAPPGGESLRALAARVARWMDAQAALAGQVLVIADAAVIRAALLRALDAQPPTFWHLEITPLSLSSVQHAGDHWRLRQLNLDVTSFPGRESL
ncbi:MAG TPA: histidine phosphatase family protein [Chloroflexota bacterium]|nr:histidine phosphatase family protein [Chloroflexota bacterium]